MELAENYLVYITTINVININLLYNFIACTLFIFIGSLFCWGCSMDTIVHIIFAHWYYTCSEAIYGQVKSRCVI